MKKYLKLMRVHHYIKNLLVFAALICSGQFFDLKKLVECAIAFVAFCLLSSVVYIINDIKDKEKDSRHPTKCKRPIAAGTVSVKKAEILAVILFLVAFSCNAIIFKPIPTVLLVLYFFLNLSYSLYLKNIPIIDITILVAGFLIRILYGAIITDIVISNWLYLTVIVLAFYFALGKRRNELKQHSNGETRQVLKEYSVSFLDKSMTVCLTLANAFYALWSMDDGTVKLYGNSYLVFTTPIVLLITMKYSMDVEGSSDGDPVEVLLHDKVLLCMCAFYLIVMFGLLYI